MSCTTVDLVEFLRAKAAAATAELDVAIATLGRTTAGSTGWQVASNRVAALTYHRDEVEAWADQLDGAS